MQAMTWNACGSSMHAEKQVAGSPNWVQPKKHCRSWLQPGDVRQARNSLQQFSAMHSLHGDPSSGHTGPSPQKPPEQVLEQHSPALEHAKPSFRQAPPHTLPLHTLLQQTDAPKQGVPSGWQPPPQTPLSQVPLQHIGSLKHGVPLGAHSWPQVLAKQMLLQHSPGEPQVSPLPRHGSSQIPPRQLPLQHALSLLHSSPMSLQLPQSAAHTASARDTQASSQLSLQQVSSTSQIAS